MNLWRLIPAIVGVVIGMFIAQEIGIPIYPATWIVNGLLMAFISWRLGWLE